MVELLTAVQEEKKKRTAGIFGKREEKRKLRRVQTNKTSREGMHINLFASRGGGGGKKKTAHLR